MRLHVVAIVGPTACGKTRLGVEVAHRLGSEIVSADSRQVYRGLDIGTGKDLAEYAEVEPPFPTTCSMLPNPTRYTPASATSRTVTACCASCHRALRLPTTRRR